MENTKLLCLLHKGCTFATINSSVNKGEEKLVTVYTAVFYRNNYFSVMMYSSDLKWWPNTCISLYVSVFCKGVMKKITLLSPILIMGKK